MNEQGLLGSPRAFHVAAVSVVSAVPAVSERSRRQEPKTGAENSGAEDSSVTEFQIVIIAKKKDPVGQG
jgi:hypothetical protein